MNCMPSLSSYNHFDVLYIENTNEIEMETQDVQKPEVSLTSALTADFGVKACCPKWEKLLPKKFIIAAMEENPTSLKLKVEIKTTDTVEKKSVTSLVDCRATREFIDWHYAKSNCFNLVKLSQPIPVYNVDGTPSKAGSIMEVVNLILHHKNHLERTTFAVSSDTLIACIDTGACNFSDLPLINITEIMSI